jgi:3-methyladenine DNA glycosylase/8-oxoguanine DNA glycosylase
MRMAGGVVERLLHVGPSPVRVRGWHARDGYVHLRAEAVDPALVEHPVIPEGEDPDRPPAGVPELEMALERMRFVFALQDDMGEFFATFKQDPLIGPTIHHKPWVRPRRRPWPWEALAWAITAQLIQASRAAEIQRRMVRAWGPNTTAATSSASRPGVRLRDVPPAAVMAGRAPAELESMDLSAGRAVAMVRCAREVERGRASLGDPASDQRLMAIPEIGPWTLQCLGLHGRGDPDSLPAGDLAYVKLVGHLEGLGRQATVAEVEEYFAPYAPFRGLAGAFALVGWHKAIPAGLRKAPDQLAA